MKKLFLLFVAAAAMSLVSCGNSSQEGSESSAIDETPSIEMPSAAASKAETPSIEVPSAAVSKAEAPAESATCSKCGGSGKVKCSKCGGKGYYRSGAYDEWLGGKPTYGCSKCGGKGSIHGDSGLQSFREGSGKMKCPKCHGTGKV